MSVFPSPATSVINITNAEDDTMVRVFNVNGKMVLKANLKGNQLDISNLEKGVYIVDVENLGKVKFIKQ